MSRESACLDGHTDIALDARHAMMNKFRGPEDGNFKLVANSLKELADLKILTDKARTSRILTKEESKCLRSFTSDYRADKDRNERRVPGTCQWVLGNKKFLDWRSKDTTSLLWVSADPGCGKSVLSRALVDDDLLTLDPAGASICYFFFKDDDINRQSDSSALSAILHQLFVKKRALLKYAMPRYEEHGPCLRNRSREMWDILEEAARDPEAGEIVCILDALDECKESSVKDIIKRLGHFYSTRKTEQVNLKFLVTSRPYSHIESKFIDAIQDMESISLKGEIESESISKEIDKVIPYEIRRISRARKQPFQLDVQDALISQLQGIPHQTYLWLHLILDVICKSLDSTQIHLERLINNLPRTVEDVYEKILKRVEESGFAPRARGLLHIIVAAERPLTVRELNIAHTLHERLEKGESCSSYEKVSCSMEREESFPDLIRNLCGFFVSIKDSKIYLIHQTARDFLISNGVINDSTIYNLCNAPSWKHSFNLTISNRVLARICISFIMLEELDFPEFAVPEDLYLEHVGLVSWKKSCSTYDFLPYAAVNWNAHFLRARVTERDVKMLESALAICETKSTRFKRWFSLHRCRASTRCFPYNSLMAASCLGLEPIVKLLFETHERDLVLTKKDCARYLFSAADHGYLELVELLLQQKDIGLNFTDKYGYTALSQAVIWPDEKMVKLLLKQNGIELNHKTKYGQSPLSLAAGLGHAEVVKILLEKPGVEINCKGKSGRTPLSYAAEFGRVDVVKILLAKDDVEIECSWELDDTPLLYAARYGHAEVVKMLLEKKGIEINRKSISGQTPLSYAAQKGFTKIIKLLLKRDDIELNRQTREDQTPLGLAAKNGHLQAVSLLLQRNEMEINCKNTYGETPLHLAAKSNSLAIISLLLEMDGIDINCRDTYGQTPLAYAVERGHVESLYLLLQRNDIDINCTNVCDETPLLLAVKLHNMIQSGNTEIVKTLLESDGVEVNCKNENGKTPLSLAAEAGNAKLVRLLLDSKNVDVNCENKYRSSPLSNAAHDKNVEIVRLLLEKEDIEINCKSNHGCSPLLQAAELGHANVVQLLLDKEGIEVNCKDIDGHTSLCSAVERGYADVVQLLLEKGAEFNPGTESGQELLSLGIELGHTEVVKLLQTRRSVSPDFNSGRLRPCKKRRVG